MCVSALNMGIFRYTHMAKSVMQERYTEMHLTKIWTDVDIISFSHDLVFSGTTETPEMNRNTQTLFDTPPLATLVPHTAKICMLLFPSVLRVMQENALQTKFFKCPLLTTHVHFHSKEPQLNCRP